MPKVASTLYADIVDQAKHDPSGFAELAAEVDPIRWMRSIELKTEKGEDIEFRDHMPLEQIYLDLHPNQASQKGSQIGMTETVINKLLWYGDYHRVTTIYTMPTATHVYDFSQSRFSPVIKSNPYLSQRMKGSVDNATLKRIGNSWFHFRGAQKTTQAISIPADILVHDEFDFSDIDILDAYGKRTGASKLQWQWSFSTPTLPGWGINALFDGTDQRHWVIRCERCNTWNSIDFYANVFKRRSGKWYFGCHKCQKQLKRREGIWVAMYPDRATDAKYDSKGRLVESATGTRGYWINPLTFTFVTAENRVKAREKAEKSNRPIAVKNFHNFDLGIPYASGESLITDETIISKMRKDYPIGTGWNVMGVDQGDNKHWVIKKVLPGGEMPTIAKGVTTEWDAIKRIFGEWDCRLGVTDALPNKDNARALVKSGHHKWWMAYYKDQHEDFKKRNEDQGQEDDRRGTTGKKVFSRSHKETQTILVDRTESLDFSAAAWISGRSYLVGDPTSIGEENWEFIQQMTAMKRDIVENTKGIAVAVWVKLKPDHWRHADNLACVGSQMKKGRGNVEDIQAMGSLIGGISLMEGASDINGLFLPNETMGNPDFHDW